MVDRVNIVSVKQVANCRDLRVSRDNLIGSGQQLVKLVSLAAMLMQDQSIRFVKYQVYHFIQS